MTKRKYTDKPCCQQRKYIDETVLDFFDGDEVKFKTWMNTPNPMLGDVTPMKTKISVLHNFVQQAVISNEFASGGSCLGCQ